MAGEITLLIQLSKAFLQGSPLPEISREIDAERLFLLAETHSVIPIAAVLLADSPAVPPAVQEKFQQELYKGIWIDTIQQAEISSVNSAFSRAGIRYLPLKGAVLKKAYPETWFRPMVDYDILVEQVHIADAKKILSELGYQSESSCEHHYCFVKPPAMTLELHHKLISEKEGFHSSKTADWKNLSPVSDGSLEYQFTPEDFYQYMFEHFLYHHWISRGVILRHFIDIYFFTKKIAPQLDRAKLEAAFSQKKLLTFVKNIEHVTRVWFEEEPADSLSDSITQYVFQGRTSQWNCSTAVSLQKFSEKNPVRARLFFLFRKVLRPEQTIPSKNPSISSAPRCLRPFLIIRYWCAANFRLFTHIKYYKRLIHLWRIPDSALRNMQKFQKSVGLDVTSFQVKDDHQ